jgi:hypothetical protein
VLGERELDASLVARDEVPPQHFSLYQLFDELTARRLMDRQLYGELGHSDRTALHFTQHPQLRARDPARFLDAPVLMTDGPVDQAKLPQNRQCEPASP